MKKLPVERNCAILDSTGKKYERILTRIKKKQNCVVDSVCFFGHRPIFYNHRKSVSQFGRNFRKNRLANTVAGSFNSVT